MKFLKLDFRRIGLVFKFFENKFEWNRNPLNLFKKYLFNFKIEISQITRHFQVELYYQTYINITHCPRIEKCKFPAEQTQFEATHLDVVSVAI